jgi:hypothetical protein
VSARPIAARVSRGSHLKVGGMVEHLYVDTDSGRIKGTRVLSETVAPQLGIRHQQVNHGGKSVRNHAFRLTEDSSWPLRLS